MKDGMRLGLEGCGIIENVGEGVDKAHIGKKIGFFTFGWGTHTNVPFKYSVLLPDKTDLRQAASPCINPLASCVQTKLAKESGSKYYIMTAAASANAKMTYKYAKTVGLE
eukprot:CAMPEP_0202958106 /NCGR_PEP_ID=MMETSP1396-20130829/2451_1 /ASSEMBLY_ACC=CAM_ASM_000872 /TAXON_ID= /ORGANISM="Pseudokeronopsis sp., Strain Brazil" /LENGTH=109 /DNA_ID=CAMNT_0049675961 /DNA_START=166 /DNA_END=495 /DNA_ORIENTATION=+